MRGKFAVFAAMLAAALIFAGCPDSGDYYGSGSTRPNAPSWISVGTQWDGGLTTNSITISWSWWDHWGSDAFRIERATSAIGPWDTISWTSNTSFTDTGLLPNTTMFYRVIAVRGSLESVPSETVSGTTRPLVPANVTATGQSGAIQISWSAASGVTHHRVEFATSAGGWFSDVPGATAVTGNSFIHTGLPSNTTRWYRVTAINSAGGQSQPSGTVSATTLP